MIERIGIEQWQQFDRAHPAPTFFARPAWALALADAYDNMEPAPLRIRLDDGTSVLLPTMQMAGGKLHWKDFRGFPLGAYTCFLLEDGGLANTDQCERALRELAHFADTATIVPWPLHGAPRASSGKEHETAVVDLSQGLDAALAGVAGIFRRMAGQAARRGVECARSNDPGAVQEYYHLLQLSAERWGIGRPSIPRPMFEALRRHGGDDVEFWFARYEGHPIGGGVVFYGSREFFFWSAAMDAEYGRLRPSNALNWALLHAAAQRGMQYYNLGSSEGLPGVSKFKENLGAQPIAYRHIALARPSFRVYTNIRRVIGSYTTA